MRLATWNILNGMSLVDGRVDVGRLRTAARSLRADVLGMQEVDRYQPRSHGLDLVAEVARGGTDGPVAGQGPAAVDWRFEPSLVGTPGSRWRPATDDDAAGADPSYGVGLVSAWPVRSWHVLRMAAAPVRAPILIPGTRRFLWVHDEPRVVLAAVVDSPAGVLTVATVHLSFVPGWNVQQLRRVTRWLARFPGPHVLLGDMNMPAGPARITTGWQVMGRGRTFPSPDPKIQLDHVLGHGMPAPQGAQQPSMSVSDHRPLVVDI